MKYRVYLDNCCFNRPYDDQSSLLVHLESEAKLFVQKEILKGTFDLAWSYILDYENSVNPYENRRNVIAEWRNIAAIDIDISDDIVTYGKRIMNKGIKEKDALHIACAVKAKCDYFLTTDKKLLKTRFEDMETVNPLDFIKILEDKQ